MTLTVESAEQALGARLDCQTRRPLAVAFSGGGDSLALLLIAKAWADRAGRPLLALTVDHRLQEASGAWATWCGARAAKLGAAHETLVWAGPKPMRGVPAAARAARHRLIAEAARRAGANVVLFGHTADDVTESHLMRAAGVRISAPRSWSPSPVWPEGRDLFILRPLIGVHRSAIREWLRSRGETWIEDPANEDVAHPRVRARALAAHAAIEPEPAPRPVRDARFGPSGDITLPRTMASVEPQICADLVQRLGVAIACAAGSERTPRRNAIERLAAASGEATLGGARIVGAPEALIFARETGDNRGRACGPLALRAGEPHVWDGRFEVRAREPGLTVMALRGLAARLPLEMQQRVLALHPVVRLALPAVIDKDGVVSCPTVADDPRLEILNLTDRRFAAACGAIDREADIGV